MKGESLVYFYGRLFGIVLSLIVVTAHSESLFLDPREDCCPDGMMVKPGTSNSNCSCIYPIKIGLLLDNVSANFINSSSEFQHEVSSQLGLADVQIVITAFDYISTNTLNISLDIGPINGVSFNLVEAAMIRHNLYDHKVQFDPSLVGDYTVLSFRQMVPEAPPPSATISTPPAYAPSPHAFSGAMPLAGKLPVFQKSNNNPRWILIVVIVSAMGLVVCCLFLYWRCVVSVKGENIIQSDEKGKVSLTVTMLDSKKEFEPLLQPTGVKLFSYVTLKEATNNFDAANLLGEGGFGRVYCGILKDGTLIAVKKLTTGSQQGDREFLVEVELLSRLHHRNLVKLLGYFSSHDSTQQLLCYELVPNGSLESWLHGPLGANNPLSWEQRMRIAIGAARGLAYLHEDSQPCVIHRDFKASNILLENNFHAKVSDFGLAKLAPDGHCNPLSTRVMGTFGYVAPEYAMTGHLLVKCDVYSYGVVLLELLSGRKPVDMSQPPGQQNLVTWARPLFKDTTSLEELADPRLEDKYPIEGFAQVAAIAAACVAPEPNQRPSMGEVVQSLKMVQHSSERSISGDPEAMMKGPASTSIDGSFLTLPTNGTESGTFESDSSSVISSGHLNVFSIFDHENVLEPKVLSEDLTEVLNVFKGRLGMYTFKSTWELDTFVTALGKFPGRPLSYRPAWRKIRPMWQTYGSPPAPILDLSGSFPPRKLRAGTCTFAVHLPGSRRIRLLLNPTLPSFHVFLVNIFRIIDGGMLHLALFSELSKLKLESSNRNDCPDGDGGASIGPLQISEKYKCPGYIADRKLEHAKNTVVAYWMKYCKDALEKNDWDTLAKIHNGGPQGPKK